MRNLCLALILFLISTLTANAQSGLFIAPNSSPITSPVTGQSWLFNSTDYTLGVWTGSSYRLVNTPFSNYTASTNPTSSNDNTQGYVIGSLWVNQTTQEIFMATNVATSAAVWLGVNQVTSTIPLANIQQGGATNGQSLMWNNGSGTWAPGNPAINLNQLLQSGATNGQTIVYNSGSGAWQASNAGAGTVTNVSTGNLSPLFTAAFSSPTSTPTLSFSLSNATAKSVLGNTSGSPAGPAYIVPTITAGTGLNGGTQNIVDNPTISLATPVTVANGGTGLATFPAHNYFGNNTGSTAAPTSVSIVAADLPSSVVSSVSNSASILNANISAQNLAFSYSGTALPLANGGTGGTSASAGLLNLIGGSPLNGQVLEFNGSAWVPATVSGTGTVTSVGMTGDGIIFNSAVTGSPITTSGTLVPVLKNQNANTFLAGPSSGSAATPTFRFLATADLPSSAVTNSGNLSTLFNTSISAQTLSFTANNALSKGIFSNPSGSLAPPGFNALTITAGTGLSGGGNLADSPTISLSSPVAVANGGLNLTSAPSNGQIPIGNGTGYVLSTLTAGNGISVTNGSGSSTISMISPVTVANGGLNLTSTPTNGQLPVGNGSGYTLATITPGTGVAVTNGSGSITVGLSTPVAVANGGTGTALFTSGTSTFVSAGSVAVADTTITSSSIVVVTQVNTSPLSEYFSIQCTAGTGFTIYSSNSSSTAVVNWIRIK